MKKMKRLLSVLLSAALMVGSFSTVAYADEPVKKGWVYENDVWSFYRDNGKLKRNSIQIEPSGSYYLDADGKMPSKEIIHLWYDKEEGDVYEATPEGNEWKIYEKENAEGNGPFVVLNPNEVATFYANPNGKISQGWRMLNGDGSVAYNEQDESVNWYFFGLGKTRKPRLQDDEKNALTWEIGNKTFNAYEYAMVKNRHLNDGGKMYRFKDDGVMYREEWVTWEENGTPLTEYYTYFGYRADAAEALYVNGPNGEPETWYSFGEDGTYEEVTASDANAYAVVEGIEYRGGEPDFSIPVGESKILNFKVHLATSSDAQQKADLVLDEDYHDIFVEKNIDIVENPNPGLLTKNVKAKLSSIKGNTVKINYEAMAPGSVTITLHIDGVPSSVTINNVMPSGENGITEGVQTTADNMLKNASGGLEKDCVNGTKAMLNDIADDAEREAAKAALCDVWTEESAARSSETKSNRELVSSLENSYAMELGVTINETEVSEKALATFGSAPSMTGAALNMDNSGEINLVVDDVETPTTLTNDSDYSKKTSVDISVNGLGSDLTLPVIIDTPIPEGYSADNLEVYHIHDGVQEKLNISVKNGTVSFAVNSFSEFIFAEKGGDSGINGGIGDSYYDNNDSYTSSSTSSDKKPADESKGVTTIDEKKGVVNTLTGIVTGEGDGYSKWVEEKAENGAVLWKLQYADGTMVGGKVVTKEDGTTYEQPAWEMVNGKWFAFDADGYADAGWVYDTELGGWFFIDINDGMKTGWQLVGGLWYYLQPVSDGKKGIMYADRWIDGWYVDASGAWDGKPQVR